MFWVQGEKVEGLKFGFRDSWTGCSRSHARTRMHLSRVAVVVCLDLSLCLDTD